MEAQYNAVQKIINDAAGLVLYENKPAQQAMDEAQRQVEALVAKS